MQTQLDYFVTQVVTIVVIRTYLSTQSIYVLNLINTQLHIVNSVMQTLSFANCEQSYKWHVYNAVDY